MVHFVGAGSGAVDLITVRGAKLLSEADVVIYAGSLVNPEHLNRCKAGCEIHDSAKLTLEEVIEIIKAAEAQGKTTVRLHTGDSSIYGAVREQFDELDALGIAYDVCPGVSAFCGAAAALKAEYTPARCEPDRASSPAWRAERPCRKRKRFVPLRHISPHYGAVPQHRPAGRPAGRTDGGRLCPRKRLQPSSIRPPGRTKSSSAAACATLPKPRRRTTSPKPR